jgi:hypothetical protein
MATALRTPHQPCTVHPARPQSPLRWPTVERQSTHSSHRHAGPGWSLFSNLWSKRRGTKCNLPRRTLCAAEARHVLSVSARVGLPALRHHDNAAPQALRNGSGRVQTLEVVAATTTRINPVKRVPTLPAEPPVDRPDARRNHGSLPSAAPRSPRQATSQVGRLRLPCGSRCAKPADHVQSHAPLASLRFPRPLGGPALAGTALRTFNNLRHRRVERPNGRRYRIVSEFRPIPFVLCQWVHGRFAATPAT